MDPNHEVETNFKKAEKMIRIGGLVTVIWSAVTLFGVLISLFFLIPMLDAPASDYSIVSEASMATLILFIIIFFIMTPSIFLLISHLYLTRKPEPAKARRLITAHLIISAVGSFMISPTYIPILVIAIISLGKASDYERGYKDLRQPTV